MSSKLVRWSGPAAVLGGLLIFALTILEAYDFHRGGPQPTWVNTVRPLLSAAMQHIPSSLIGRPQFLGFLFLLIALIGLHARLCLGGTRRTELWGYRLAVLGLVGALLGNVGDMWIGPYVWGTGYERIAIILAFLLFLGGLLFSLGSILIGISVVRSQMLPSWSGWLLIIGGTASVPVGLQVIHGLSAVHAVLGLAWAGLGLAHWARTA